MVDGEREGFGLYQRKKIAPFSFRRKGVFTYHGKQQGDALYKGTLPTAGGGWRIGTLHIENNKYVEKKHTDGTENYLYFNEDAETSTWRSFIYTPKREEVTHKAISGKYFGKLLSDPHEPL